MGVNFGKTSYLKALRENEHFKDDSKIAFTAKNDLQFKYGDVTAQRFNQKYSADGWLGRKVIALPAAAWSGVVKTIYHLALAIFIGIPKAFSDQKPYLRALLFHAARDLQESYGQLASLFNDRYGQFHVQESQFQKACYGCFIANAVYTASRSNLTKETVSYARSWTEKYGVMIDDEAKKISLADYREKTDEERAKLIQRFKLNPAASLIADPQISLNQFVDQAEPEILKLLTLEDLIIPFQHSKLKFALLSNDKFKALTPGDLEEEINQDQLSLIKLRLEKLSKSEGIEKQQKPVVENSTFKDIRLADLTRMSIDEINAHRDEIPDIAFKFFTNDQIQNLKLSELKASQVKALFFLLNEVETKERLALFGVQDIVDAIYKGLLTGNVLRYLGSEHLNTLKLTQLNTDQADEIFCWKKNPGQDLARFKAFNGDDVQKAIETEILTTTYQLKLLSDEHLQGLKLSQLSQKTINNMFPWNNDNTADRKRFANFQTAEVQAAIKAGLIATTYQLKLLSDEHLQGLKLSELSKETMVNMFPWCSENTADLQRFANLQAAEVQAAINSGLIATPYQLHLLSDQQLMELKLSELSKATIDQMFSWHSDNTADRKRFANFQTAEVQAALKAGLITRYQMKLLSDLHLQGIKLSELSAEIINEMFSWCQDDAADRKRFANFPTAEVQAALDSGKLSDYVIKLISNEQMLGFDFSALSQKLINVFFPPYAIDRLREENSHWSSSFVMVNGVVKENRQGKQCSYTEEELQKMSNDQKQKNEALFRQLSAKQKQDLEPRLYQKDDSAADFAPEDQTFPEFASFDSFFKSFFQHEFGAGIFSNSDPFFAQFFGADRADEEEISQDPKVLDANYKALELEANASEEEIKKAYRRLALKYHSDKNLQDPGESAADYAIRKKVCEDKFKEITEAFKALTAKKK